MYCYRSTVFCRLKMSKIGIITGNTDLANGVLLYFLIFVDFPRSCADTPVVGIIAFLEISSTVVQYSRNTLQLETSITGEACSALSDSEVVMNKSVKTDFLFAQPSFVSGAARILDMWGTFDEYNRSETALEADEKAIAADWIIVGQELNGAIGQYDVEAEKVA